MLCKKYCYYSIIGIFILSTTKLEISASSSTSPTCDIKNENNSTRGYNINSQTFTDLWGFKHNWQDPEDGWDEKQRKLFISRQKEGIFQTKRIPEYTKHGYKKMPMPPKLYKIIYDLRKNSSFFTPEACVVDQLSNCMRKKKDGIKETKNNMLMNFINDNQEVHKEIKESLLPIMGDWCGLSLKSAVVYGIRRYLRGSWLGLHVDRLPTHIISVILQIDQKVDQEWPLTFIDHKKKKIKIYLKPGEMLLYESAKNWHGRQFPLNGDFFDNVFIHFTPNEPRFEKLWLKMESMKGNEF